MVPDGSESAPTEDAFAVLAHEIRIDILRAFFDRWSELHRNGTPDGMEPLTYSELMSAAGMRDSGKFNYHLERLRGVFVDRVEGGYLPTAGAVALYRAVLANRPLERVGDVDIGGHCPACGDSIEGSYDQEYLRISCSACEEWWGLTYPFPKQGLVDRTGEEVVDAMEERALYHVGLARTGQCPVCAAAIGFDLGEGREAGADMPAVEFHCDTCGWFVTIDLLNALRSDPQVTCAVQELGGESAIEGARGEVESAAPLRVRLTIHAEDGDVAVIVGEGLEVERVVGPDRPTG